MAKKLTVVTQALGKQLLASKSRRSTLSVGGSTVEEADDSGVLFDNTTTGDANTMVPHQITQNETNKDTKMETFKKTDNA